MNRHVILSLLSTTAANWFGSAPTQQALGGPDAGSLATARAMDALERRQAPGRARLPGGGPFGTTPAPAAMRGAWA